ncbi:MAG: hypothetical protein WA323_10900 [Candidatus Nitrosopolaris sp.]
MNDDASRIPNLLTISPYLVAMNSTENPSEIKGKERSSMPSRFIRFISLVVCSVITLNILYSKFGMTNDAYHLLVTSKTGAG